jgi:hypothetical protein
MHTLKPPPLAHPPRAACVGKEGQVVIDLLGTVDKVRLVKRLGAADSKETARVPEVLGEFFAA